MSKIRLKYFTQQELLATNTGLANEPTTDAVWARLQRLGEAVLDPAREALGLQVRVNSGYRSYAVNKAVGGANLSQHTRGEAADITCADNYKLWQVLMTLPYDQLIRYVDRRGVIRWLHVSYREGINRQQQLTKYI